MTPTHHNVICWNQERFNEFEQRMERAVLAGKDDMASLYAKEATRYARNIQLIENLYR